MPNEQAEEIFEKGINALSNGHVYLALVCFEQASNLVQTPSHNSYLAFCLAKTRRQYSEAIALCTQAMEKEPTNSAHYLNLGRIYDLAGQREKSLQTLRQGLQLEENNQIVQELEKMGIRKPPVIRCLSRNNPINKYCGILLKMFGLR